MTTKHTPGPWRIEVIHVTEKAYTISYGENSYGDGPEGSVGKVYVKKEDANLIAAAPELLQLLQEIVQKNLLDGAVLKDAQALIAKAL